MLSFSFYVLRFLITWKDFYACWLCVLKFPCFLPLKVLHYKGILHCFCDDILQGIWCPCVLANTACLLADTLHSHHEATDNSHDQIQICSILIWKAGIWWPFLLSKFRSMYVSCFIGELLLESCCWFWELSSVYFTFGSGMMEREHHQLTAQAFLRIEFFR